MKQIEAQAEAASAAPTPAEPAGVTTHPPAPGSTSLAPEGLSPALRARGLGLGFVSVRFCGVDRLHEAAAALERWRAQGYAAGMAYMSSPRERADPRTLLPGARSLVVAALPVRATRPEELSGATALDPAVANYARGDDYHVLIKRRLRALADACADLAGRVIRARACVDSAPLLERAAAARAGAGFVGKSTLLIVPGIGPQVLLGELLLDIELTPDPPIRARCGRCTACLDACPTGAFPRPYELDARRCISYLTIEHDGPIPRELRAAIGLRVFGCDVCQEVCPYDRARRRAEPDGAPPALAELVALLEMGSGAYRRLVRGRALARASRVKLASNAAIALGNLGDLGAVDALARALARSPSPVLRAHAAWALGRLGGDAARSALDAARLDPDAVVREEVLVSRAALDPSQGDDLAREVEGPAPASRRAIGSLRTKA